MITQDRLKEVLHYSPDNGVFTWKISTSPVVEVGNIAGGINGQGYHQIQIDGRLYQSHRLAWLYVNGYFPECTIDHVNRVRDDNRISNLREASRQCQARNRCVSTRNTSGAIGFRWIARDNKWLAHITVNNYTHHLGTFQNWLEAAYHRFAAEQCLGFRDCDNNSSAKQFIDKERFQNDNALAFWGPM